MAFSVKIEAVKFPLDTVIVRLEPSWWDPQDLIRDTRFKYSNDTGSYADYTANLTVEEFRALHKKYRPEADNILYNYKSARSTLAIMDLIDDLLDYGNDFVRVTAFEWESGY